MIKLCNKDEIEKQQDEVNIKKTQSLKNSTTTFPIFASSPTTRFKTVSATFEVNRTLLHFTLLLISQNDIITRGKKNQSLINWPLWIHYTYFAVRYLAERNWAVNESQCNIYPLLHQRIVGVMDGSTHGRIRMMPQVALGGRHVLLDLGTGQHQRRGAIGL